MAISTQNGTTVGISATLPATYDGTGYGVPVFTTLGQVLDVGEIAKAYSVIAQQHVGLDYPEKLKGTYDIANVTLNLSSDSADAGQVIALAALASANSYSFKFTLPSGDLAYITAKVVKFGQGAIATNGVESKVLEIAVDPQSLYEA